MSKFILPPNIVLPEAVKQALDKPLSEKAEERTEEQSNQALPTPVGYNMLCIVPKATETFEGSMLYKAESYKDAEEIGTTVLYVLRMGSECYQDKDRFPNGPWCKEGDFILVRTYAGTRFKLFGQELRLLKDDQVEAVVVDPRGLTRVQA